jgi:hypothetical protein
VNSQAGFDQDLRFRSTGLPQENLPSAYYQTGPRMARLGPRTVPSHQAAPGRLDAGLEPAAGAQQSHQFSDMSAALPD